MAEKKYTKDEIRWRFVQAIAEDSSLIGLLAEMVSKRLLEDAKAFAALAESRGYVRPSGQPPTVHPIFQVPHAPAPVVHVNVPEQAAPIVNVPELKQPTINVAPAAVSFQLAEDAIPRPEAPIIHVNVSPTPLEVHNEVLPADVRVVNMPMRKIIERDADGRVSEIREQPE